jgi:hypothetical protein
MATAERTTKRFEKVVVSEELVVQLTLISIRVEQVPKPAKE